ncbi:hypothetical protein [Urechidicola croceus]|uniref:Lipoprotein n=1 Tax=Urechidicola croceus TaxID=1850246 RepID=A0A1D8P7I0_9FLAO|nr:hypothetical protein [Urechidicola croceus]AOW20537.1 hypothetical protein LPB138_07535 [Urechidicola croceus]
MMIVTKMSFLGKNICVLLTISLFFSCKKKENIEEKHTYEIISLIYNNSSSPMMPPPAPLPSEGLITKEDSIYFQNYRKQLIEKKQIIAIEPKLEKPRNKKVKVHTDCKDYENLLLKYYLIDKESPIEISKIVKVRKDSILYFKEEMINRDRKEFENFDILLSFSQIAFNKEYDKAIIATSRSTSRVAGGGSLVFLEHKDGHWSIKCLKRLWIS